MIQVIDAAIPAVQVIYIDKHADARGSFSEVYHHARFSGLGIRPAFIQDNQSFSVCHGTVRGLHFQKPPFAQDKLVRVISGAIFDVAVDLRRGSPTFGAHVGIGVSAEQANQVFIPAGFAHGFCTLVEDTTVVYKTSHYYAPAHEGGIVWNDPDLKIAWPVGEREAILSDKDRDLPRLRDIADELPF